MTVALIDNGSLEPAAHHRLRAIAAALSERTGRDVQPVSWKHSNRIPTALMAERAWTLGRFIRHHVARGEREFLFVPFFISAQGAIGTALRTDLERIQREVGDFDFMFSEGLAARGALPAIVADRVRETALHHGLANPRVIIVDHGGPSPASAKLRDDVAREVRRLLGVEVADVTAASMEGLHPPLLEETLREPGFAGCDIVVAMLFLSPGRHAGPAGDVAHICRAAGPRIHLTGLVGDHPAVIDVLAAAIRETAGVRPVPAGPRPDDSAVDTVESLETEYPVEAGGRVS